MGGNHRRKIDVMRDRIRTSEQLADADADVLTAFSNALELRRARYSDARHEKLLRHVLILAENTTDGDLAASLAEREAAERLVRWINRRYDNEETNRDYRVALRVCSRYVADENGDDPTESIDWVPSTTARNYDPKPDPREMLHWDEHIRPMIDACENTRDEAMIAVAWDAGCRSGEFRSLRVGDVTDHPNGLQITVDGKTGQRTVTLIPSVPFLNRWLSSHAHARCDHVRPDAPLWPRKSDNGLEMSFNGFQRVFAAAANRAGVSRPVTLTNFRKSSATFLASQGLPQAHIEDHHGWTRGSSVAARYVAVFSDDADRALAEAHGLDVSESEPDPTGPIDCPRCGRQTPRDELACVFCGQSLSPEAAEVVREQDDDLRQAIATETGDRAEALADLGALLDEHPVLRGMIPDE